MTLGRCLAFLGTGRLTADIVQHVGLYTVKAETAPGPEVETEGSYWVSQNVWVFCKIYWKNANEPFGQPKVILQLLSFFFHLLNVILFTHLHFFVFPVPCGLLSVSFVFHLNRFPAEKSESNV